MLRLKNGVRVVLAPDPGSNIVTVLVTIRVGSRNEDPKTAGKAHYLEHILFKGTKRRPTPRDISGQIERYGGQMNASTAQEETCFQVTIESGKAPLAVDILHDMLFHSIFDRGEMRRERKVVLEEIAVYADDLDSEVCERYYERVYAGTFMAHRVIGTPASVKRITRESLIAFHRRHYAPENIIVSLAGGITADTVRAAKRFFGGVPATGRTAVRSPRPCPPRPSIAIKRLDGEQVYVMIGFPTPPFGDRRIPALKLLAMILGDGMSSRLFTEIREKRGLAYSIHSAVSLFSDSSHLSVVAGLNRQHAAEGVRAIMSTLGQIAREGVTREEFESIKDAKRGQFLMAMESSTFRASFLAERALWNLPLVSPERFLKQYDRVTHQDISDVAREFLKNEKLCASIVGPIDDPDAFAKLLKLP
jgi:predicted Zn-dependent peptidase